jgi:hypothetical protein
MTIGRTRLDEVTEAFQRASVAYFAEAVPLACGWEYIPHPYIHGEVMIRMVPKENETSGAMYLRRDSNFSSNFGVGSNFAPREAYKSGCSGAGCKGECGVR